MFAKVTHVIFDMDGLLINTEDLYSEAYQSVCDEFGVTYTFEMKSKIMGMKYIDGMKILLPLLGIEDKISGEEFVKRLNRKFPEYFPKAKILPGVENLIKHLKKNGIPFGISTGSSNEAFEMKETNLKSFFAEFDFILKCGSDPDIKQGKPGPDPYLVASKRFSSLPICKLVPYLPIFTVFLAPENCLAFEDSPNGVLSARAAGMQCVMIPDRRLDRALTKKATLVLDSMEDFKPELFGLPPFSK